MGYNLYKEEKTHTIGMKYGYSAAQVRYHLAACQAVWILRSKGEIPCIIMLARCYGYSAAKVKYHLAACQVVWILCSKGQIPFSCLPVQFSSVQGGIYALEKAHMRCTPSLGSFPNVALSGSMDDLHQRSNTI